MDRVRGENRTVADNENRKQPKKSLILVGVLIFIRKSINWWQYFFSAAVTHLR